MSSQIRFRNVFLLFSVLKGTKNNELIALDNQGKRYAGKWVRVDVAFVSLKRASSSALAGSPHYKQTPSDCIHTLQLWIIKDCNEKEEKVRTDMQTLMKITKRIDATHIRKSQPGYLNVYILCEFISYTYFCSHFISNNGQTRTCRK